MAAECVDWLKKMDPRILSSVVRRCLELPEFTLGEWSVSPLRHEKVIETTGGLFSFRGSGWGGCETRYWSVVLKIINRPGDDCQDPQELCYWRREALAYQTGMLSGLPGAVRAPRCYGVYEHVQDAWIWLEEIEEGDETVWSQEQFQRAARCLGRFAGAYLTGRPVPGFPWLCASLFRSFYADGGWWARFMDPASAKNAWQSPLVQAVYLGALQSGVLAIWSEKWQWVAANERLPRVLCHNDAHRRNLMLRAAGELVAIDWGFSGPGGLGNDLGELVGTSLSYFTLDPADAPALEEAVLEGYQAGLRDAGWEGDTRLARLGYLIALALYWGGTLPCEIAMLQPGEARVNVEAKYGRPLAALLPGWTRLAEFTLERADEARYWIGKMYASGLVP